MDRAGFSDSIEVDLRIRRTGGHREIVDFKTRPRLNGDPCWRTDVIAGRDFDIESVVVEANRADSGPVIFRKISGGPAFWIRLVRKVAVVGNDVAIDFLDALSNNCVYHLRKRLVGRSVNRIVSIVRDSAVGKFRIAASNENNIAAQTAR